MGAARRRSRAGPGEAGSGANEAQSRVPAARRWAAATIVAVVLAALIAAVVAYVLPLSPSRLRIDPGDAKAVALGRRLYAEACAGCHGAALEGQADWQRRRPDGRLPAPPHDASGHTWHHPDAMLFDITKRGPAAYPAGYATDMPAFADRLTDEEIAAVLAFIKSTWPPPILERQMRIDAAASR